LPKNNERLATESFAIVKRSAGYKLQHFCMRTAPEERTTTFLTMPFRADNKAPATQ
jgi:hypothetical protein